MKVTRPSATSLHIRVVPWLLWLIGAWFAIFGLGMVYSGFGQTSKLTCTRIATTHVNCTLSRSLLGVPTSTTTIQEVQGARLGVSRGQKSSSYRVEFLTNNGVVPMTSFYSSGSGSMQSTVDRVNSMVRDPHIPAITVYTTGVLSLLFVLLFVGIGICFSPLLWGCIVTWVFDTIPGTLTVRRSGAFRAQIKQYALSDIRTAAVQYSTGSKGGRTSRIALRLHSGEEVPLTNYYSSGSSAKSEIVVGYIQQLLNLDTAFDPANEPATPFEHATQAYGRSLLGDTSAAAAATRRLIEPAPNQTNSGFAGVSSLASVQASAALAPDGIGGIFARILGVALLQRTVYRAVAEDPSMTAPAGLVVVVVAALVGCIDGLTSTSFTANGYSLPPGLVHAAASVTVHVLAGVIGWLVGSAVFAGVATMLRGNTNVGEMARVLGFVSVFNLLWAIPIGFIPALILSVRGTMMSISEAAEFDTRRVIATAIISWLITFAVIGIAMLVLNLVIVGPLIIAFGERV